MSDGPREPRRDGTAPQPVAKLAATEGQRRAGGPQASPIMRHFSATSLSISPPSRAAQGASADCLCEDPVHGQTSGQSCQVSPPLRQAKPLHVERGSRPGSERVVGARAKAWLRGGTLADTNSDMNSALIACWRKSWCGLRTFWG